MNTKKTAFISQVIKTLRTTLAKHPRPLVASMIAEFGHDPFIILISCLLSLRTRDTVTIHVCRTLFTHIRTPQELLDLPMEELEQIIYKTGYYKTKTQVLLHTCTILIEKHNGEVPRIREKLLAIKGVGLKTANLVLGLAYNIPAICVDTHVHRISNLFDLINTKTAEQSEKELTKMLPKKYWIEWNKWLVTLGQNICTPPTPKCSQCPLNNTCPKKGVTKFR